jgi:predicted ATPase
MLRTLAIANYRSLRQIVLPLDRLTAVTGANGVGKSNLYRALRLLAACARGDVVRALAQEGGMPSTLWAGPERFSREMREGEAPVQGTRRSKSINLQMGFAGDDLSYLIDLGLPNASKESQFGLDPEIKREMVWTGPILRPATTFAQRRNGLVQIKDGEDAWQDVTKDLQSFDSMLAYVADPVRMPELLNVREQVRSWRFYDQLRTDQNAPARRSHVGTRTMVLADDGADLAAALQTIREIGDADLLEEAVEFAFPGSTLDITRSSDGRFNLAFQQPGLLRPLGAAELSDGTLRYLLWTAALLTPRPPELMVLNEPETSLHPDLVPAMAYLIGQATKATQVIVVSHSAALIRELGEAASIVELTKELSETRIAGADRFDGPSWNWGKR